MALYFSTANPKALLDAFHSKIVQKAREGKIETWVPSDDGRFYTHAAKEWHRLAWMKPRIGEEQLVFNIVKPKNKKILVPVYGYYHGHLLETFLNHLDGEFEQGWASARGFDGDQCG